MKKNASRIIPILVLLVAELLVLLYFGMQKQGFHEDEYYSWYSTNRTAGLYVPDDGWLTSEDIMRELTVQPGEGFRYGAVHEYQSWDVHPPLFYDLLHTVCSFTPGVFSKWQGLAVNITAFIPGFFLVIALSREISKGSFGGESYGSSPDRRKFYFTELLPAAVWGFNPMTISCVMFIRMYMWLTVWILLCALLHIRYTALATENDDGKKRGYRLLILMGLTDICGFLTHYYYLVFLSACGLYTVCLFILRRRQKAAGKELAGYIMTHLMSGVICVLVYPASLTHIFRGYRGKEAQASMFDISNLLQRISFFTGLVNRFLFGGFLLAVLIIVAAAFILRRKREAGPFKAGTAGFLLFASLFYFLVVSKTALLLGDTSNRYEMPVYPLFLMLAVSAAVYVFGDAGKLILITAAFFLIIDINGTFVKKDILFLYREDADRIRYAGTMAEEGAEAVVCYNEATPDHLWYLLNELMEYPRIYCTDGEYEAERNALVYVHDSLIGEGTDVPDCIKADGGAEITPVSEKAMWKLYRVNP